MLQAFTELTEDLKICGINPVLHFMDNEASAALKWQRQPWTSITSWLPQVITGQTMQRDPSRTSKTTS